MQRLPMQNTLQPKKSNLHQTSTRHMERTTKDWNDLWRKERKIIPNALVLRLRMVIVIA